MGKIDELKSVGRYAQRGLDTRGLPRRLLAICDSLDFKQKLSSVLAGSCILLTTNVTFEMPENGGIIHHQP
jgi:hypothetical protein